MSERVGRLRLIQKIEADVLGEIHCVAWPNEDGLEDVGLLRLFERDAVEPESFLALAAERRLDEGTTISDVLALTLESGVSEDGRAYDLYPFVSGCSLATLTRGARSSRETYPIEVALWIAGRIASGLSVAFRQELAGENLLHGFLTPFSILISDEGEVRLCGLETAPALREMRATAATFSRLLPYLSPEARGTEARHPSDDVYSLGAMLYELLTLSPLASSSDLREDSAVIPSELRYFLARSVAPRFRRIQSVVEWLHELKSMVVEEGWIASALDLSAFFSRLDDRADPPDPDTAKITEADRQILECAIRKVRAEGEPRPPLEPVPATPTTDPEPAGSHPATEAARDDSSYQTSAIPRDVLEAESSKGRLVRTAHVKLVH